MSGLRTMCGLLYTSLTGKSLEKKHETNKTSANSAKASISSQKLWLDNGTRFWLGPLNTKLLYTANPRRWNIESDKSKQACTFQSVFFEMFLVFAQDLQTVQDTAFWIPQQHEKNLKTSFLLLLPQDRSCTKNNIDLRRFYPGYEGIFKHPPKIRRCSKISDDVSKFFWCHSQDEFATWNIGTINFLHENQKIGVVYHLIHWLLLLAFLLQQLHVNVIWGCVIQGWNSLNVSTAGTSKRNIETHRRRVDRHFLDREKMLFLLIVQH